MTKLYHYITKGNTALTESILSFAKNPQADLHYYYKRTGGETTRAGIVQWLDSLQKYGLIEAVYISPALRPNLNKDLPQDVDEHLVKLNSINEIDSSPVDWSVCNEELGLHFSVVPYYLIVIKSGIIPPKYITKKS